MKYVTRIRINKSNARLVEVPLSAYDTWKSKLIVYVKDSETGVESDYSLEDIVDEQILGLSVGTYSTKLCVYSDDCFRIRQELINSKLESLSEFEWSYCRLRDSCVCLSNRYPYPDKPSYNYDSVDDFLFSSITGSWTPSDDNMLVIVFEYEIRPLTICHVLEHCLVNSGSVLDVYVDFKFFKMYLDLGKKEYIRYSISSEFASWLVKLNVVRG